MNDAAVWLALALGVLNVGLLIALLVRSSRGAGNAAELREELRAGREESARAARESREELTSSLRLANDTLSGNLTALGDLQRTQLADMTKQLKELSESNSQSIDRIRLTMDVRVKELQEGNEKKLEEMRKTVDEKLHDTLEKRLGESFKLVSAQLEAVQRGVGEMHSLATGVGDLKRVLTNVKARGTWAEVQLGALLEQILAPSQYDKNVRVREDSAEAVEFAIRLPGPSDEPGACVWMPIDSKFPQEDYLRIQEAAERGDVEATQKATEALARTIRVEAQRIHDKYLCPPSTTDFGVMFLATEGLYAEVLRQPDLVEELQRRFRVVVAGPTSLAALLSSIRMGFQTIAIEEQAFEVRRVLGAVKTEFGKFGDVLDKVKRQLSAASNTIEQTGVRTRAMERRLRDIDSLPEAQASQLLDLPALLPTTDSEADAGADEDDELGD